MNLEKIIKEAVKEAEIEEEFPIKDYLKQREELASIYQSIGNRALMDGLEENVVGSEQYEIVGSKGYEGITRLVDKETGWEITIGPAIVMVGKKAKWFESMQGR